MISAKERHSIKITANNTAFDRDPSKRTTLDRDLSKRTALDRDPSKRTTLDRDLSKRTALDRDPSKRTTLDRDLSKKTAFDRDASKRTAFDRDHSKGTTFDRPRDIGKMSRIQFAYQVNLFGGYSIDPVCLTQCTSQQTRDFNPMLAHRLRCWTTINTTSGQSRVSAGIY